MSDEDEKLDALLREWVQEGGLEQAPHGFVQHVMQAVEAEARPKWRYVPPIGRWGWVGIAAAMIVVVILGILLKAPNSVYELPGKEMLASALDKTQTLAGNFNLPILLMWAALAIAMLFFLERGLRKWMNREA